MKFGKVWSEELELSYFEHLLGGAGMDLVGAESPRTICTHYTPYTHYTHYTHYTSGAV